MDRPSFTFSGGFGTIACDSPLRQYEKAFREGGVPFYVHLPSDGPVSGEFLAAVEADLADPNFMSCFQNGLRDSQLFRDLHIQPGNYGNGQTHESIFQKLAAVDLQSSRPPLEVFNDPKVRHMDTSTPEGCLKELATGAAICSVKMNFALNVGSRKAFAPLADASPYASLVGAKYGRAARSPAGGQILATDLSLAIFDELIPSEKLAQINMREIVRYRNEASDAREAFLEHLLGLQAKLGGVPKDEDYEAAIRKIITTEIRPAAREFRNKLDTIYEKLFGKVAGAAAVALGSSAVIQVLGDVTWQKLLALSVSAAAYVAPKAIDALIETRAVSRDCALSYLLDFEK